ncbi:MAG: TetR/AcrR family transcriptional regulator [Sphingobacteriaceae bacterium]|nr:MAG: TetR/AcrR family transcriptional regulator [Sphingobacteriaceae bacterium]
MKLTEQNIVNTAIYVLNENPSATLEMVADKAGISSRTLYRYFNDREKLIDACKIMLTTTCREAMNAAFDGSDNPLIQLELTLYAAINCGSKFAFFEKLNQIMPKQEAPAPDGDAGQIQSRLFNLIVTLQKQGLITDVLTSAWIYKLFSGMVNTTISAISSGDIAINDINRFAWISFSQSIGIQKTDAA